jgi:HAD superfamily hydrolase (TIGR01484 family)
MQNILLFIDLDDTLFQTKRKNPKGSIPATLTAKTGKGSYMTQAQQCFFELFYESEKVKIIPSTARDFQQYQNTLLSQSPRIETAILYFSGMIFDKGTEDKAWQAHIQQAYQKLKLPISALHKQFKQLVNNQPQFTLYNVDNYYITVKADQHCPLSTREALFSQLKSLATSEYFVHENDRAFSLLPHFLDKRYAVKYLIEKYQPELTLGMGDSLTDWPFMQECDFRIIPKQAQIERLFQLIG